MRASGKPSLILSTRPRSTSATAISLKPGCFAKLVMSESAIPLAPMLAWRTVAASAANRRDEPIHGATAAPAASDFRNSRRVTDMSGFLACVTAGCECCERTGRLLHVLQRAGDQPLAVEHLGALLGAHRVAHLAPAHLARPPAITIVFSVHGHAGEFTPRVQRVKADVEIRVAVRFSQP